MTPPARACPRRSDRLRLAAALAVALTAAPAAAETFDTSICRLLPQYVPSAEVAYTPGIDVHGRPVAPADVRGSAGVRIADRLDIPLTLGLARRLGLAVPPSAKALGTQAEVGRLSLFGDVLLFNGQPLGEFSQSELIALCRSPPAD
ncbi:hypothetical protein [Azospirillum sp. TSO22-1]|uniref:hypothetical protein n=1 Tax=Azospirillum sp. TSO22-1 TaxID=716789 RepID=UPI000D65CFE6|nr:hypothetical protein [Azospirillum sp. TSO22-1]